MEGDGDVSTTEHGRVGPRNLVRKTKKGGRNRGLQGKGLEMGTNDFRFVKAFRVEGKKKRKKQGRR